MSEKKKYVQPTLDVYCLELECGIASGSSKLYPGGPSNDTPQVDNWKVDPSSTEENQGYVGEW